MRQVPDSLLHSSRVVIDQCDFLRGIDLRHRSHMGPQEKPKIPVLFPVEIGVQEFRMSWIVDSRQNIGVYVVHVLALKQGLRETQSLFPSMARPFSPAGQNQSRSRRRFGLIPESWHKLQANFSGESENGFVKVFIDLGRSGAPYEFALVEIGHWF